MGRKRTRKILNSEEVVWDGTWKGPKSMCLTAGFSRALQSKEVTAITLLTGT